MKTTLKLLWMTALLSAIVVALSGCYTQIATKDSDDQDQEYTNDNGYREDDDSTRSCCDDDQWESRYRGGFSYYYGAGWPSSTFAMAYNDPWSYGLYGGGYGGYGYGYSPYSYYNNPYYGSYYGSYYGGYYYNPYSYYYSVWSPLYRKVRDFGSTRGGGGNSVRGGTYGTPTEPGVSTGGDVSAPGTLPTGGSIGRSNGGVVKSSAPDANSVRSSGGTTRRDAVSGRGSSGSAGSRGSAGTRSETRRERQRTGSAPAARPAPSAPAPSPARERGVRPSESSAPSSAPRSASPAPQSRGGSTRGSRP